MSIGIDIGLDRLVDGVLGLVRGKIETDAETKRFLGTCIEKNKKMGQDWVREHSYLLDMERAFVPMRLARSDGRSESLSRVLSGHDRLVIQGQPGGGKSTLVQFISLIMAKASLDPNQYGELPQERFKCPVLFPLKINLEKCNDGYRVYDLMLGAVPRVSGRYIEQRLDQGHVLFIFDGLDEVADGRCRFQVMSEIRELTDSLRTADKANHFIVTTRAAGYRHRILAGGGYALYTLQELAPEQQEDMVRRYNEVWAEQMPSVGSGESWQSRANELIEQLRKNPGLARLKNNPLLLSQIAMLHFQGESLPAKRHELYEMCISHLIRRRDEGEMRQSEIDKRMALSGEVALAMHKKKECKTFTRAEIEETLAAAVDRHPDIVEPASQMSRWIESMEHEWGLLIDHASQDDEQARYSFSNLSFQEYLTAYIIHRYPDDHWPVLRANLRDDWWQEVVLLYTAMPFQPNRPSPLDQVLDELLQTTVSASSTLLIQAGRCLASERLHPIGSKWHDQIIRQLKPLSYGSQAENIEALQALCRIEPDGRRFVLERILGRHNPLDPQQVMDLLRCMNDPDARQHLREALLNELDERPKIDERILLAEALGQIQDTRLSQMVEILPGSDRRVKTPFRIAKYPVSNVEYAEFVEEEGWQAPPYWLNGVYPFRLANHPVTHVSIHDAEAYCKWFSKTSGRVFRLPTEVEWLAAAEEDEPGRRFPWGGKYDRFYFNWRRTLGDTSPVGIYFEGETEHGVADLLGNVWEWTQEREGAQYVLRGGAWDSMDLGEQGLRARSLESPSVRRDNIGFRIIEEIPQVCLKG